MLVAINVPDMDNPPTTCRECPLALWGEWHDHCAVNDKSVTEHIIDQTKPDWCSMCDVGGLIHGLYESLFYEYPSAAEKDYKQAVESLGIDVSDVHCWVMAHDA